MSFTELVHGAIRNVVSPNVMLLHDNVKLWRANVRLWRVDVAHQVAQLTLLGQYPCTYMYEANFEYRDSRGRKFSTRHVGTE